MFRRKGEPYRHVISFGMTCQPAWFLRKNKLRVASYPFDWIYTPTETICQLLETDFRDFLHKPSLWIKGKNNVGKIDVIQDNPRLVFAHDFTREDLFDEELELNRKKFARRIERLYQVLNSGDRTLLVRCRVNREEVARITRTIDRKFPNANYTMLAVDSEDHLKEDWKLPNVVNVYAEIAPDDRAVDPEFKKPWKKALKRFRYKIDQSITSEGGKDVSYVTG